MNKAMILLVVWQIFFVVLFFVFLFWLGKRPWSDRPFKDQCGQFFRALRLAFVAVAGIVAICKYRDLEKRVENLESWPKVPVPQMVVTNAPREIFPKIEFDPL